MNQINDLPPDSSFGLDFDYSVWAPGTQIQLSNVSWNSDYRDIVYFDTHDRLDRYITFHSGPAVTIDQVRHTPPGYPVRLEIPHNVANRYNYLRVFNPAQPINGDTPRTFYYFINDVRYVNPSTTELMIQLDVWQTYGKNVTFGKSYIERGHVGIANENAFNQYGREYLTVPEGLDVGSEYEIGYSSREVIADVNNTSSNNKAPGVVVASTTSLIPPFGDVEAPRLNTARGSSYEGLPNGCELYYFQSIQKFTSFASFMSDKPWVMQGIISVTVVPNDQEKWIDVWVDYRAEDYSESSTPEFSGSMGDLNRKDIPGTQFGMIPDFRDKIKLGRYSALKKFLTFPYCAVELTTFSGVPIILKPELISSTQLSVKSYNHYAPPSPRIMWVPDNYNKSLTNPNDELWDYEFLDVATGITNLPTFSVANNAYLNYMASNASGIAFQHQTADWSQSRAMAGNSLSAQQASASISQDSAQTNIGVGGMDANTALANQTAGRKAMLGGATSLIGGAAGGAPGLAAGAMSAASSGVNFAIDSNHNTQSASISNNMSRASFQNRSQTASYMRDSNKQYADFAAQGDYSNAIAGINAKVQDAKLTPPTTAGQVGGDAFNLATTTWSLYARVKTVTPSVMAMIGEFWLRYGYAVNRFGDMPPTFQVMSKFTFWKLKETYITSQTCPESFKQTIRGIFEKGVTVWKNPDYIGTTDNADNTPYTGVTL